VDVYFILQELLPWDTLQKSAGKKHVGMEPHFLARALLRVRDLRVLPDMIKPITLQILQDYFLDLAKRLMDDLR